MLVLLVGCSTIPSFDRCQIVEEKKKSSLPESFEIVNSIRFQFKFRSITAIGIAKIDIPNQSFSVVATNPMGMTLFELKSVKGELVHQYVLQDLAKMGDITKAVAQDIQSIFFDLENIELVKQCYGSEGDVYSIKSGEEIVLEYYNGDLLVKKQDFKDKRLFWTIEYLEYDDNFPRLIILKHSKYKYTLTLNVKNLNIK
jgi:hypothetical protein